MPLRRRLAFRRLRCGAENFLGGCPQRAARIARAIPLNALPRRFCFLRLVGSPRGDKSPTPLIRALHTRLPGTYQDSYRLSSCFPWRAFSASASSRTAPQIQVDAQPTPGRNFDGEWYSYQNRFGFSIESVLGITTPSNSPKLRAGDQMLHLESKTAFCFQSRQFFSNGRWYAVTATMTPDGRFQLVGWNNGWTTVRKETGGSFISQDSTCFAHRSPRDVLIRRFPA